MKQDVEPKRAKIRHAKRYYREGRRLPSAAANFAYVQRKIEHMNRMGIPATMFGCAACPQWLAEELTKKQRAQK